MNTGLIFTAILSLLLALTTGGNAGTPQATTARGHNLNHNETIVRDAPGQHMDEGKSSVVTVLLISYSRYRTLGGCFGWVCGSNHSETLVRDTTRDQRAHSSIRTLIDERSLTIAQRFIQFSSNRAGGLCPPWMCNHNETLVSEVGSRQAEEVRSATQWFSLFSRLLQFSAYRVGSGCNPMVCGANHNETLVRDADSRQTEWSELTKKTSSFYSRLSQSISYNAGAGCSPWICGSNHNETFVRDSRSYQTEGSAVSRPASSFLSSLLQYSAYRVGAGCSPWVCGSNHSETLVRDNESTARVGGQ